MAVNFVRIPEELKASCRFCTWKYETRGGRKTKVPYTPGTMHKAQTDKPETFGDFSTAMKAYAMGGCDGIGIRVASGIGAIDIDHCIREDGSLNDIAASILGIFPGIYTEKSPSGTGLRAFFKVSPDYVFDKATYYINNRKLGVEIYVPGATNRFVTVTGNVYRDGTVPLATEQLTTALDTYMKRKQKIVGGTVEACSYLTDEQVIEHASRSESGDKFKALYEGRWQEGYESHSDADMAFVSMLAFWCGNVEEQIDRIFRSSGMMRPKWDRQQSGSTYGAITIRNAVSTCSAVYRPIDPQDITEAGDEFSNLDGEEVDYNPDLSQVKITLDEMQPQSNPRYGRDEIGVGNMFADYFKGVARYNRDRGIWYVYDGAVWRADTGGLKVAELAKLLADRLLTYAIEIMEEDTRKRFIDRIRKLQQRKHRDTMLKDAKSVYPLAMSFFDRDIYLFNLANGTLDLKTREFREHRAEDFLTKISPVVYDPDADCPRWTQFMEEVMQGDEERIRYIRKALGYALSGDTRMECLFILYGATSRNGKGTMMETFLRIMGDYGRNADPALLAMKFSAQSNGPTEEVARLAGSRFVNISEPEKKLTMDAAFTKRMTGNDSITARFLHENSFEFRPNFKIFINTNHLPNITDLTLFDSGRIKIIPFNRHFEEEEQDKGLKAFFAEEDNMSGIFNWLLEGYRLFEKEGLTMPRSVLEATDAYHRESDRMAQFFTACIAQAPGKELRTSAMYTRYQEWCRENGYRPESMKNFKPAIDRNYTIVKKRPADGSGSATSMVLDVEFLPDEEAAPELVPIDG